MTSANDTPASGQHAAGETGERILDHNRLQLSALMDGALSPDEARFLLRRLQHDEELADCWTRWQLCGDVMRGRASMLVPAEFSQQVATAIAAEAARQPVRRGLAASTWARWGGGAALAASVAVFALFMTRQAPDRQMSAPARVAIETPVSAPAPTGSAPVLPSVPDTATQLAAAVAVADVPRRAMRRSRGQSQRAAIRVAARGPETQVVVAAGVVAANVNPFAPRTVVQSRPWPRALLPTSPASGAFTVEYGSTGTSSSFYPFAPRTPAAATDVAPANATDDVSHTP